MGRRDFDRPVLAPHRFTNIGRTLLFIAWAIKLGRGRIRCPLANAFGADVARARTHRHCLRRCPERAKEADAEMSKYLDATPIAPLRVCSSHVTRHMSPVTFPFSLNAPSARRTRVHLFALRRTRRGGSILLVGSGPPSVLLNTDVNRNHRVTTRLVNPISRMSVSNDLT